MSENTSAAPFRTVGCRTCSPILFAKNWQRLGKTDFALVRATGLARSIRHRQSSAAARAEAATAFGARAKFAHMTGKAYGHVRQQRRRLRFCKPKRYVRVTVSRQGRESPGCTAWPEIIALQGFRARTLLELLLFLDAEETPGQTIMNCMAGGPKADRKNHVSECGPWGGFIRGHSTGFFFF